MPEFVSEILRDLLTGDFGPNWRWSIPLLLWLFMFFISPWGLKLAGNEADRKYWVGNLIQGSGKKRYTRVMTRLLDGIDTRLSGPEMEDGKNANAKAWSLGLLNLMTLLAVAYPIVSFVVQWTSGSPLRFGGFELVPVGSTNARLFIGVLFATLGILYLLSAIAKPRWRLPSFICATVVLFAGVFFAPTFDVPLEVGFSVAFAILVAFLVVAAFLGAFAFSVAAGYSVAFAGVVAVASLGLVAGLVAIVGAFVGVFLLEHIETRIKTPLPRLIWLSLILGILSVTKLWQPETPVRAAYTIIFFGLFPILNALADFASVGLTRLLLRRGLSGLTWKEAVIDAIGGTVIFALLGMAAITWIHLIRPPDGEQLLNLSGLFHDLHTNPQDMWWLAIMLGSTLLPTALHLAIGMFTLLLSYPEKLREWVVTQLNKGGNGSTQAAWLGGAALSAMLLASIWIPVLCIHTALTLNHAWLIKQVIGFFEGYARLIGAT